MDEFNDEFYSFVPYKGGDISQGSVISFRTNDINLQAGLSKSEHFR